MILYFGNVKRVEGKITGEPLSLFINDIIPTVFQETLGVSRLKQVFTSFALFLKHRRSCRLVHIASYSTLAFYNSVYLAFLCKLFGKRYFVVVHGGDMPRRLKRSKRLSKFVFGGAYRVITPSGFLKHHFVLNGYAADCVPNFIPLHLFEFKERETFGPNILWVRTFHKIYNTKMAARVMHHLIPRYPNIRLLMVGREEDNELAEFVAIVNELGLQNNITIAGQMKREDWVALSVAYDIFISTTTIDNTPLSIIEAMALGLPVISTDVGGVPYIVEDQKDGLLVSSNDDKAMAACIEMIMQDAMLGKKLARNGREKAESFSWEKVKKEWAAFLDEAHIN